MAKKKPRPQLVESCDECGAPLGRLCERTPNSSVCAAGEGIATLIIDPAGDRNVYFFCSDKCRQTWRTPKQEMNHANGDAGAIS